MYTHYLEVCHSSVSHGWTAIILFPPIYQCHSGNAVGARFPWCVTWQDGCIVAFCLRDAAGVGAAIDYKNAGSSGTRRRSCDAQPITSLNGQTTNKLRLDEDALELLAGRKNLCEEWLMAPGEGYCLDHRWVSVGVVGHIWHIVLKSNHSLSLPWRCVYIMNDWWISRWGEPSTSSCKSSCASNIILTDIYA